MLTIFYSPHLVVYSPVDNNQTEHRQHSQHRDGAVHELVVVFPALRLTGVVPGAVFTAVDTRAADAHGLGQDTACREQETREVNIILSRMNIF